MTLRRRRTQLAALMVVLAGFGLVLAGGWLWVLLLILSAVTLAANLTLARRG